MAVMNGQFTRTNSFGQEADRVFPEFFVETLLDEIASEREGRKCYRDEERVRLHFPGNPHTKPVARVTEEHRQRWPEHYDKFKRGITQSADGIPIEEWPKLNRAMVFELKALGLETVEQIASMNDHDCQRVSVGGVSAGRQLRDLARAFIDDSERNALAERLSAENSKQNAENAELRRKVEEQRELLERLHSQVMAMQNAPNPIAAVVPAMLDPVEQAKGAARQDAGAESALAGLTAGKRRPRGELPLGKTG